MMIHPTSFICLVAWVGSANLLIAGDTQVVGNQISVKVSMPGEIIPIRLPTLAHGVAQTYWMDIENATGKDLEGLVPLIGCKCVRIKDKDCDHLKPGERTKFRIIVLPPERTMSQSVKFLNRIKGEQNDEHSTIQFDLVLNADVVPSVRGEPTITVMPSKERKKGRELKVQLVPMGKEVTILQNKITLQSKEFSIRSSEKLSNGYVNLTLSCSGEMGDAKNIVLNLIVPYTLGESEHFTIVPSYVMEANLVEAFPTVINLEEKDPGRLSGRCLVRCQIDSRDPGAGVPPKASLVSTPGLRTPAKPFQGDSEIKITRVEKTEMFIVFVSLEKSVFGQRDDVKLELRFGDGVEKTAYVKLLFEE